MDPRIKNSVKDLVTLVLFLAACLLAGWLLIHLFRWLFL